MFDQSWYSRVIWEYLSGEVGKSKRTQGIEDIKDFEEMLHFSGTVILKFWLHISKKKQEKNLRKLEEDSLDAWKVGETDWWQNKHYDKVTEVVENVLDQTSVEHAPWRVVEMEDKYFGRIQALQIVADTLYESLIKLGVEIPPEASPPGTPKAKKPTARKSKGARK